MNSLRSIISLLRLGLLAAVLGMLCAPVAAEETASTVVAGTANSPAEAAPTAPATVAAKPKIVEGMSVEAVLAALGKPKSELGAGSSRVLWFDDGHQVTIRNGKVSKLVAPQTALATPAVVALPPPPPLPAPKPVAVTQPVRRATTAVVPVATSTGFFDLGAEVQRVAAQVGPGVLVAGFAIASMIKAILEGIIFAMVMKVFAIGFTFGQAVLAAIGSGVVAFGGLTGFFFTSPTFIPLAFVISGVVLSAIFLFFTEGRKSGAVLAAVGACNVAGLAVTMILLGNLNASAA